MLYAHVTNGTIDAYGQPPNSVYDGTSWHDLTTRDPAILAAAGWYLIAETPPPDPIDGGIHEPAIQLVDGLPTRVWTWRAWTDTELAQQAADTVRFQLATDTSADLDKLVAAIDSLALLLADNTTSGSIRAWKAPITNGQNVTGAQAKALADLLITDAQATRRIARQVLRLARAMVGNYSSADVGTD